MSVKTGTVVTFPFTTADSTTQASVAADSLPTGALFINMVADPTTITVVSVGTGVYSVTVTLPTLVTSDDVAILMTYAIDGVTSTVVGWEDAVDSSLLIDMTASMAAHGQELSGITDKLVKSQIAAYSQGVWLDTVNGEDGTELGVYGLSGNPLKTFSAAMDLASNVKVNILNFSTDSLVVLDRDLENWELNGLGTLDLNGHSIDGCKVVEPYVQGACTGADAEFHLCAMSECSVAAPCWFYDTFIDGPITFTTAGAYSFLNCAAWTPFFTHTMVFTPDVYVGLRNWSGAMVFEDMDSSCYLTFEGNGRVTLAPSCTGGNIRIRGSVELVDNVVGGFKGSISQDARLSISEITQSTASFMNELASDFDSILTAIGAGGAEDLAMLLSNMGDKIDIIKMHTDVLKSSSAVAEIPISDTGVLTVYAGDAYASGQGRSIVIPISDPAHVFGLLDSGVKAELRMQQATWTATQVSSTVDGWLVTFEPTSIDTAPLTKLSRKYRVVAVYPDNSNVTLGHGILRVQLALIQ